MAIPPCYCMRSGIHTYTIRRVLRIPELNCKYDKRLTLLAWAQNAVVTHEQFQLLLLLPLEELKAKSGVQESIAEYIGY